MGNDGRADGNMFNVLADPDIVKDWEQALEPIEEVFEPTKEGEENISLERLDVEAIIASQPQVKQEEDLPQRTYTGLCSGCIRPDKGLCPCGDMGANFDPKSVNVDLAVRRFDEPNELVSG